MEENQPKKISLTAFLLILAIIIILIMGLFIFKLINDKSAQADDTEELKTQISDLNTTIENLQEKIDNISKTVESEVKTEESDTSSSYKTSSSSNSTSSTSKDNFKSITLDGKYTYAGDSTDITWDFSKDGRAAFGTNLVVDQGTYKTTKENYIEIHYTKEKIWDDDTNETTTKTIDKYEYLTIEDGNIYLTDSNGKKEKLERIGDVTQEQFN